MERIDTPPLDEEERRLLKTLTRLRPRTREDCDRIARPCLFVGCRYHLYLEVHQATGRVIFNFPELEPHEMSHSCALDYAELGGETLDNVGAALGVTGERARQVEEGALEILERRMQRNRDD